tara:strand:- start:8306 stop:8725 length:420 start_codon:yes stop_codon:yes gene_type:complete
MSMELTDVPQLMTLPNGKYRFNINRARMNGPVGKNNRFVVEFSIKPTEVLEGGFPEEQLDMISPVRHQYWITEKSIASKHPNISIWKFFELLEIETGDGNFGELLEACVNRDFEASTKIGERSQNNPEPMAEIDRVFTA